MHRKLLTILLPLMVILTMLASLITPSLVFAAGEPPPPPGEKSPKAPAAPDKPAPPASDTSYTTEIPVTAPLGAPDGADDAAVALSVDAIAQAGAVLVGPSGNPLPLATQETASVLNVVGDVYFKGSGTGCSGGWCKYDTIFHALAAFASRSGSGAIYATGSLHEPDAVIVDGALNLSKLTGLAWDGTTNYIPQLSGGWLAITNMLKGFKVDGFYAPWGIMAYDNAGTLRLQNLWVTNPAGYGILVTSHKGNIDLFNVTVSGASNSGAWLDNTAGAGNVTISNSSFNNNGDRGLYVNTKGSALLDRSEANANLESFSGEGAYLNVGKGATVKDSRFNYNQNCANGLLINGLGAMNLQNVEAQGNTANGILLDIANDITLNGGFFAGNSGYGLQALTSGGNITINNIQSLQNLHGMQADNSASVSAKTVTVSNSTFSNSTSGDGLRVLSKGNITLNHIDAENNTGDGAYIDNLLYDDFNSTYKGSGSVSLLNTLGLNQFIGNDSAPLMVFSRGAITVKGVLAFGNQIGLELFNCAQDLHPPYNCLSKGNLSLSAVQVDNNNWDSGLEAISGGAISLDGSSFNGNQFGVVLDNAPVTTAKTVTITHSSFNDTSNPGSYGLLVFSRGSITLNNVQANNNQGNHAYTYGPSEVDVSGILLDNCIYDDAVTHACTGSGSVSVLSSLGASKASGNSQGAGLFILSKGAITVSGFSSTNNGSGAFLDNHYGAGTLTVTNSTFSQNYGAQGGLTAHSARAITLNGVEATLNSGGLGAHIINTYGTTTTDPVTISKSKFEQNQNGGLMAFAKGNLTLNNVNARSNDTHGNNFAAYLASSNGGVTMLDTLGPNQFSYNVYSGLGVSVDNGAISIRGVMALYNGGNGITLDNASAAATKTVTAQKILAAHNNLDGLNVQSKGSVTLNGVQANFNSGGYGVNIDNCLNLGTGCTGSGNVSLLSTLGLNSMSSNKYGLLIESAGSVLVNGTTASNNANLLISGVSGVWIENYYTLGKTVTVNQGNFNFNYRAGLVVISAGVITLNNISASYNLGTFSSGVYLYNAEFSGSPGVNILSTSGNNQFNGNVRYGLMIESWGNIVLNKVIASDNGVGGPSSGAVLYTGGASTITITCSAFNHNQKYGLEVSMGTGKLS
jgi:hypothetical protein